MMRHALAAAFMAGSPLLASCSNAATSAAIPTVSTAARPNHRVIFRTLYTFKSKPDGAFSRAGLTPMNGLLYGTTFFGGMYNAGSTFSVSASGTETLLHSFAWDSGGAYPIAPLLALNGSLYGTASEAGAYGAGAAFALTSSGEESVLHEFQDRPDGAEPWSALTSINGTLYGTTQRGGVNYGTIYSLTTSGAERVVADFNGPPDGALPFGPVVDLHGVLYGTTYLGGSGPCSAGCGTVFALGKRGIKRTLYDFQSGADGASPGSGLIVFRGALYGTTESGGAYGMGTVFKITPSGNESIVYSFKGSPDGAAPVAALLAFHGKLYGATSLGGLSCQSIGCGTLFRVSPTGNEEILHQFNGTDGFDPLGQLAKMGGKLYGTTANGGTYNNGTVFSISP